uniref:Uncharacterized protein n=1 Tax=Fibrocapsa japonica TaxID=94617 RepID=A0A7S2UXS2_9STRA|mmetsp:Transcript_1894/g.2677  ORF Transcript_1894/g.2677 Transcript_1894/m.2677 type:complete len:253 (+) Transcript_1894:109-867(+)|eukprot:CAMPEP_0113935740 /NCGR_PEP_ID=MMETSP1339-20121228/2836_1 /TAXON_ID=94617 /ORGANISM="Fibrocapsa japonica" /LENGTH=252 /DNA_ID=CAMNT_0000937993 /DNA_START=104 /DNA_END=862 /DNA_ORIENTATION=+ /assembly_acc=CAM_ASM_000762
MDNASGQVRYDEGEQQDPANPPESLVKFDEPLFVGLQPSSHTKAAAIANIKADGANASQIDDMMNSMIPPREWTDVSGTWMQYISKESATRLDVITLQEQLDKRLVERQARETDICPVREDLYSQCFDELIRHVTLDSPERGLLLLRVRDEIRMTIDAYKTLYDSSVTFGIKKQLQAEMGMSDMEKQIAILELTKKERENKTLELRNKLEVIEKREVERRGLEEKKRKEEIDFLKYQGQHLDTSIKHVGGSK